MSKKLLIVAALVVLLVPKRKRRAFIDSLRLNLRGGAGGQGLLRYGGVGGDGGSVIFVGKESASLKDITSRYPSKKITAKHGEDSQWRRILGMKGEDKMVDCPLGVTVYDQTGVKLGEIDQEGEQVLAARGGLGGRKETGYCGVKGQKHSVTLDLKLIADVGLVGFPNAGKSTLLSVVSKAKPKIASYPFTTIRPQLGIIEYPDLRQISVADLPGLIEGAHVNLGMGHKFLKHVERTKLILMVVDAFGFQLGPAYEKRNCLETIILLNKELELYKEELLNKPAILIVNKMDLPGSDDIFCRVKDSVSRLSDSVQDFPEEMRPVKPIEFRRVLAASTQQCQEDPGQSDAIRQAVREVLDEVALEEWTNENMDVKLSEEINQRRMISSKLPNLV